ncbi:hypothetical protein FRC11_013316 [Ceratobasidium sp. 423]|nr:hypothetical protein FRC11_013316 [Ceratobasidium sp. 423]
MLGKKTWLAFNEKQYRRGGLPPWKTDPFKVGVNHGGKVPVEYATQSPSDLLNHEIQPFIKELVRDPAKGSENPLQYDSHSTRSYLTSKGYPQSMIDYIETMCFGTGGYDRALAETVLEELCFRYNQKNPKDLKWKCIEGGSRFFPVTKSLLFTSIEGLPVLNVSGLRSAASGGCASFDKLYSHVIFAVPLLAFGPSVCQLADSITLSEMPFVSDGKSTVLIVSYSWTQDAVALGSLMRGRGIPEEDRLKELMLADLAYVHQKDDISIGFLREQFRDMFPWDRTHHPYSMGAFGIATRGWVAEALESAERGVYQLLKFHKMATSEEDEYHNALKDFKNEWNPVLGVNKTLEASALR